MTTSQITETRAAASRSATLPPPGPVSWIFAAAVAATALILIVCLYAPALAMKPLLDEQVVARWTSEILAPGASQALNDSFRQWRGFDSADGWGPLSSLFMLYFSGISPTNPWPTRAAGLLLHWVTAALLFFTTKRLTQTHAPGYGPWIASGAALLFAVYPLNAEAVVWIGGRTFEIAAAMFLGSFYCYLRGRSALLSPDTVQHRENGASKATSAVWFTSAFALYALMAFTAPTFWTAWAIVAFYEITQLPFPTGKSSTTGAAAIIGLVTTMALASFLAAAITPGPVTQPLRLPGSMGGPADLYNAFSHLFFPINKAFWAGYAKEFRSLYFAYPIVGGLMIAGFLRNGQYRRTLIFSGGWLVLALLPVAGAAVQQPDLHGSRWLYLAAAGFCLFISLSAFGLYEAFRRLRFLTLAAGIAAVVFLLVFSCRHLSNRVHAYNASGNALQHVQESIKIISTKERSPIVLARDLPKNLSVLPLLHEFKVSCFDGQTGLLMAPVVSGGSLKEALRQGTYQRVTTRWDKDFASLMQVNLSPRTSTFKTQVGSQAIADQLKPPLQFYKSVTLSKDELVLESNSAIEPGITLDGKGLSPLDGDFLYFDAVIETAGIARNPNVELHWLTIPGPDYQPSDRRVVSKAICDDGKKHRYYQSLRSTGWTTNGEVISIILGFPTTARARLTEVGLTGKEGLVPQIALSKAESASDANPGVNRYVRGLFNYPNNEKLGLHNISSARKTIGIDFDVSHISGATGALVEVSQPDRPYFQENSDSIDEQALKTVTASGVSGKVELPRSIFGRSAVYGIRVIGTGSDGKPLAKFSDALYCLVEATE